MLAGLGGCGLVADRPEQPGLLAFVQAYPDGTRRVVVAPPVVVGVPNSEIIPDVLIVGSGPDDGPPQWSPDGTALAFTNATDSGRGIAWTGIDPIEIERLEADRDWLASPAWSPDGSRLAFVGASSRDAADARVGVADLVTGTMAWWGDPAQALWQATWLPRPDLVVFLAAQEELAGLDLPLEAIAEEAIESGALLGTGPVVVDGALSTEPFLITASHTLPLFSVIDYDGSRYAEWNLRPSPDGRQIAFESNDGGDREIYVLNQRGVLNVSNHAGADWNPVWSPDSEWLGYQSFREGRFLLYRSYVGTARVEALVGGPSQHASLAWSPGGEWYAWVDDSGVAVFRVGADPGLYRQYATGEGLASAVAWQPR